MSVGTFFVCPRCGNSDPSYLGSKNGKTYCRRCIGFHGDLAKDLHHAPRTVKLDLKYTLSKEQTALSDKVVENFKNGIDTLVYAVCGSGKTEISYGVIAYAMSRGMNVAFALPRRDVVIELFMRLREAFPGNKIVAVYGQHTSRLEGDCVILTTHQLYRYPHYFDLIVMDEIGVMEEGAEAFRKAVLSCLDGDVPVLLALKDRPDSPLICSVLEHENVAVYEVTEDNREGLYEILREARSRE